MSYREDIIKILTIIIAIEIVFCIASLSTFPNLRKYKEKYFDSCDTLKEKVKKLNPYYNTVLSFGILFNIFSIPIFILCFRSSSEELVITFLFFLFENILNFIQWSVTLAVIVKLKSIKNESGLDLCISKIYNLFERAKTSLILISFNTLFNLIFYVGGIVSEYKFEDGKFFLIFFFELYFNIIMFAYLPKESDYKKEKLNYLYELEKELSNSKNINQSLLGIEVIIFIILFFKLISLIYDTINRKNYRKMLCILNVILSIFIFIEWSLSLAIISKINELRKNEIYKNSINNIRNDIIKFIITVSFYLILKIFENIIMNCDNGHGSDNSPLLILFKRTSVFNTLEICLNIIVLVLFPYPNNYKSKYFYQVYNENLNNNNTYNISQIDVFNLEKLYTVPKRFSKAILSFSIIILVISLLKFIIYLCNKCNNSRDYKCFRIFNYFNLALTFLSLILGSINIGKIKAINIDTSLDINFLSEKIKSNLANKHIAIIILFVFCIILLIITIIIFGCCKKNVCSYRSNYNYNYNYNYRRSEPVNTETIQVSRFAKTIEPPSEILPPKIQEIIKKLAEKIETFSKTFIEKENEIKKKLLEFVEERKNKLVKFLKDNPKSKDNLEDNNKEEIEKFIKDLNKEELEIELDKLKNIVDKMHYVFNLGKDVTDEIKNVVLDGLKEKIASLPKFAASKIESQLDEVNKYTPKEFLNSKFGEPLKKALEKYGLSKAFLDSFKEELLKERKHRREKEREELSLEKNEFENEDNNLNIDLFDLIMEEYSDEDFKDTINKEIQKKLNENKK